MFYSHYWSLRVSCRPASRPVYFRLTLLGCAGLLQRENSVIVDLWYALRTSAGKGRVQGLSTHISLIKASYMIKPDIPKQECDPTKGGTLPGETASISEHIICCSLLLLLPKSQFFSTPVCHQVVKNSNLILLLLPALQTSVISQQPGAVLPNILCITVS